MFADNYVRSKIKFYGRFYDRLKHFFMASGIHSMHIGTISNRKETHASAGITYVAVKLPVENCLFYFNFVWESSVHGCIGGEFIDPIR